VRETAAVATTNKKAQAAAMSIQMSKPATKILK
jgi:hypothetical protein